MIILDIGCGESIKEDATHAIDIREGLPIPDSVTFIKHDITKIPFPLDDGFADKVYLLHTIEHFSRAQALEILREIHRVLSTDGTLEVTTPNIYRVIEWMVENNNKDFEDASIEAWGSPANAIWSAEYYGDYGDIALHHYGYSSVTLERILDEAGFEIVRHNEYDTLALITISKKKGTAPMPNTFELIPYIHSSPFASILVDMPYSSLDSRRLRTLYELALGVRSIEGDIAECGVFQGGSAFMIGATAQFKTIHLFDTFEGLPIASEEDGNESMPSGAFACSLESVKENLSSLNNVIFHPGLLTDTLSECEDLKFSMVHLDVDRYDAYEVALNFFWKRLSYGGFLVCDDYHVANCPGATLAIDHFIHEHSIKNIKYESCQIIIKKAKTGV